MNEELFSVWIFFPDETYHCEAKNLTAEQAVLKAKAVTQRPAIKLGFIKEIRIIDNGDNCVFKWIHGKGVVFPINPKEEPK